MNSGSLRTRIQIQGETITRNAYGEEIKTFTTLHTVMAKKREVSGLKSVDGDSIMAKSKSEFYIRYIPNLSTKYRIVESQKFGGVSYPDLVYRIESIIDTDNKKRELKILTKKFE